ncbi:putative phage protein [Escherichia coli]|nr:putative phage protein [Escherichia coli]
MKGIEVETPASLDLTRAAAFAIRIGDHLKGRP